MQELPGILAARRRGAAAPHAAGPTLTLPRGRARADRERRPRSRASRSCAAPRLESLAERRARRARRAARSASRSGSTRWRRSTRRTRVITSPFGSCAVIFSRTRGAGCRACQHPFWEMFYPLGWRAEITDAAGRAAIDPCSSPRWCGRNRRTIRRRAHAWRAGPDAAHARHGAPARPGPEAPVQQREPAGRSGRQPRHGLGISLRAAPRVWRRPAHRRGLQRGADPRPRVVGGAPVGRPRGVGRADPVQRDARRSSSA